MKLLSWQGL